MFGILWNEFSLQLQEYSVVPRTVESEFSDEMLRNQSAKHDLDVIMKVAGALCDGQNTAIQVSVMVKLVGIGLTGIINRNSA